MSIILIDLIYIYILYSKSSQNQLQNLYTGTPMINQSEEKAKQCYVTYSINLDGINYIHWDHLIRYTNYINSNSIKKCNKKYRKKSNNNNKTIM